MSYQVLEWFTGNDILTFALVKQGTAAVVSIAQAENKAEETLKACGKNKHCWTAFSIVGDCLVLFIGFLLYHRLSQKGNPYV